MRFLLLLFLASTAQAAVTHDELKQLKKQDGEVVSPSLKTVPYDVLDNVIPKSHQKKIDDHKASKKIDNKKKPHAEWSFFPSAYASAKKRVEPAPTDSPVPIPTVTVIVTPSVTPQPSATPSVTPSPSPLAGVVDLRKWDSPIKTQLNGTCTAFGMAAVMENLTNQGGQIPSVDLSEDHIFSLYNQYSVEAAVQYVPGNWITKESMWPHRGRPQAGYGLPVNTRVAAKQFGPWTYDIEDMKKCLDQGKPVYAGFSVWRDMASGYKLVRASNGVTRGGHSTEISGYHDDPTFDGGGYFIVKNSWGVSNGDQGFQYVEYGACDIHGAYCMWSCPTGVAIR